MHKLLNDMESTDSSFFLYEEFVWEGFAVQFENSIQYAYMADR
jgi:hypothetical protein